VRCQTSPRGTTDAVLAVELDVERIEDMAAGTDGNPDAIIESRLFRRWGAWRSRDFRLV